MSTAANGTDDPRPQTADDPLNARRFTVTFRLPAHCGVATADPTTPCPDPCTHRAEVDATHPPGGRYGRPGSLLDIALAHGVPLDHACGGVGACSTCHVIIRQGLASCGDPDEEEEDRLERARGLTVASRLACQAVPDGSMDLVVEIPAWNVNLASEGA